jgi:hypothetical protein
MNANATWRDAGSRPEFPVNGTVWERLNHGVKCAGMAVAMEEWQPWHFRVRNQCVEVSAKDHDGAAMWDSDDADLRELMIRCGVALFHLRLALKHHGCLGRVELFPDMAESGLIAKVHHGAGREGGASEAQLFQAMRDRGAAPAIAFGPERGVDGALLSIFESDTDATIANKAWLEFAQGESSHDRLVSLASSPSRPPNSRESSRRKGWLTFIVRAGDLRNFRVETDGRKAEDMAALAMIKTKTDDKHGWLAAGQAIARASLQAKAWEVTSQVFNQSFRNRWVREELRTTIGHKGYVQAIFGVGLNGVEAPVNDEWPVTGDELGTDFRRNDRIQ